MSERGGRNDGWNNPPQHPAWGSPPGRGTGPPVPTPPPWGHPPQGWGGGGLPPGPTRLQRLNHRIGPIAVAKRVFRPSREGRVQDPTIKKLQIARSLTGIVVTIWFLVSYRLIADAGEVVDERTQQVWINVLMLVCSFPVVVGAFIALTRPPQRALYLRRARRSLGALLSVMGGMFYFVLMQAPEFSGLRDPLGMPGKVVGALLAVWLIFFVLYGLVFSLVEVFRTADIHELVPPLLVSVLSWEMACLDVITGAYEGVPPGVRAAFILGAPVSVTIVSFYEARRLRRHHGLTLRGALLR